jgi:hypothetical protein
LAKATAAVVNARRTSITATVPTSLRALQQTVDANFHEDDGFLLNPGKADPSDAARRRATLLGCSAASDL